MEATNVYPQNFTSAGDTNQNFSARIVVFTSTLKMLALVL